MHGFGLGRVEGVTVFVEALFLISLMEIGDKTQIVTISLAARRPWALVLAGSVAGLAATTAIGAVLGGLLAASLGSWTTYIRLGGGVLFLALGGLTFLRGVRTQEGKDETPTAPSKRGAFGEALSLSFLAEFGDKTQIAVIILAASYAAPVSVFLGATLGLGAVAVSSVVIGMGLAKVLSPKTLAIVSAALFVAAGVLLILEASGVL